jgi:hypothetical protein
LISGYKPFNGSLLKQLIGVWYDLFVKLAFSEMGIDLLLCSMLLASLDVAR